MKKPFHINKILIPIDFSETSLLALDHAVFMANRFDAEVVFVHVFETFSYQSEISQILVQSVKIGDVVLEKLEELAKETHKKSGIKITTEFATGNVAANIVELGEKLAADIIVMGTHGSSGFEEFFVGSNAYKVVTRSDVPVLSIQTQSKKMGFRDIVLPIDNSFPTRQKIRYAIPFAKKYNGRLHVVSMMTDSRPETLHKFGIIEKQIKEFLDEQEVLYTFETMNGDNIAKMTIDYAINNDADLIMIMTEQEPSITGLIMGHYAQQIVNHSKTPVLSITPDEAKNVEVSTF